MKQDQPQISTHYIVLMFTLLLAAYLFVGFGVPAVRVNRYPIEMRQHIYAETVTQFCALPRDVAPSTAAQMQYDQFSGYAVATVDLPRIIDQGNRVGWADVTCIGETMSRFVQYMPINQALNIAEFYGFRETYAQQQLTVYEASH